MFLNDVARIVDLAAKRRVPAMYGSKEHVDAGGLMSYAPNQSSICFGAPRPTWTRFSRAPSLADLPVEQPTKFELVINLKTAKALGLTIPQSVLARADEVIQ